VGYHPCKLQRGISVVIEQIRLSWLRSFRDPSTVEIAPITLLYGQNAAGKSTILKSILFLKQSLDEANESGQFAYSGKFVDLGSATAMAYLHRSYEPTRIAMAMSIVLPDQLDNGGRGDDPANFEVEFLLPHDQIDFQVCYRFLGLPEKPELVWSVSTVENSKRVLILNNESVETFRSLFGSTSPSLLDDDPTGGVDLWSRPVMRCIGVLPGSQIGTFTGGDYREFPRVRREPRTFQDEVPEPREWGWESFAGSRLRRAIQNRLQRVSHVGPARRMPSRIETHLEVPGGSPGLLATLREDESLRVRLNRQLHALGIEYEVSSRKVDDSVLGEIYSLELRNSKSGVVTALTDVGYGVSQVLPVILEANRPDAGLVLIEQPELHLHPRLQAELGDLLISAAMGGNAKRLIVETHSEALMLRIQRRIREHRLRSDQVRVLYVDQDAAGVSSIKELFVDDNGEFVSRWPHGFFAERLQELEAW
jgi:predicted ATPase